MGVRMPDKPVPVGCLIGFFVLVATAFAGIAFWGAFKAFSKEPPAVDIGNKLLLWGGIALIPALLGLIYCFPRMRNIGKRKVERIGKSLIS